MVGMRSTHERPDQLCAAIVPPQSDTPTTEVRMSNGPPCAFLHLHHPPFNAL